MAYVYVGPMYIDISENVIYICIRFEQLDDMIKDRPTIYATRIFDMIT
jgi:hypothetical protein